MSRQPKTYTCEGCGVTAPPKGQRALRREEGWVITLSNEFYCPVCGPIYKSTARKGKRGSKKVDSEYAAWLRKEMSNRRCSQSRLARILKVTHRTVNNWYHGAIEPSPDNKKRITKALATQDTVPTSGFGKWLLDSLAEINISQRELARRLGVNSRSVNYWCWGMNCPNEVHLAAIKDVLAEEALKDTDVIFPPLRFAHSSCNGCAKRKECSRRVNQGWPMMCEPLNEDDIDVATHNSILQEIIWWKDLSAFLI